MVQVDDALGKVWDGSPSDRGAFRRAGELLIIGIHEPHERGDRLATTFHRIVPPRSARDTFVYSHR